MRLLTLFAVFLLLPLSVFAQDTNLGAQLRLERAINDLLNAQQKAFESTGGEFVRTGNISVEKTADYFAVTMPDITLKSAAGDTTDLGIISLNAAPKGSDQWMLTMALPMPIKTLNAAGTEISRVDIGKQFFAGTWDESFGNFTDIKTLYENIKLTLPDNNFTIQKFGYGLALANMTEDKTNLTLRFGFEDMRAASNLAAFDRLMPEDFGLDVAFAELPLSELQELNGAITNPAEIGDVILNMLAGSGTKLSVNDIKLTGSDYALQLTGKAQGDPDAALKAFGDLVLDVAGIDNLLLGLNEAGSALPAAYKPKVQAARMALTMMKAMGANQTSAGGAEIKRYDIDVQKDGKIFLNGNDFSPIGALLLK